MSPESASEPLDPELRFDDAPGDVAIAPACARCSQGIDAEYYEVGGAIVCPACKPALEAEANAGSAGGRLSRALLYGLGGAAAGAALYYAIVALTGYEIGLVAIAVGWMVGRAVQLGSRHRGGRVYQAIAVGLTYIAIVSTYVPYIIDAMEETPAASATAGDSTSVANLLAPAESAADDAPAVSDAAADGTTEASAGVGIVQLVMGVGILLLIAMAAPFLAGLENIIGLLIIGFALWQAWQMNRRVPLVITGPYAVGGTRTITPQES